MAHLHSPLTESLDTVQVYQQKAKFLCNSVDVQNDMNMSICRLLKNTFDLM